MAGWARSWLEPDSALLMTSAWSGSSQAPLQHRCARQARRTGLHHSWLTPQVSPIIPVYSVTHHPGCSSDLIIGTSIRERVTASRTSTPRGYSRTLRGCGGRRLAMAPGRTHQTLTPGRSRRCNARQCARSPLHSFAIRSSTGGEGPVGSPQGSRNTDRRCKRRSMSSRRIHTSTRHCSCFRASPSCKQCPPMTRRRRCSRCQTDVP